MWTEGARAEVIADALGVSKSTVYRQAQQAGLPPRDLPRKPMRGTGPGGQGQAGDALLTALWQQGVHPEEIGRQLGGIHAMTVRHHAERLGLRTPGPPRRKRGKLESG
jgi:hypothetical protein